MGVVPHHAGGELHLHGHPTLPIDAGLKLDILLHWISQANFLSRRIHDAAFACSLCYFPHVCLPPVHWVALSTSVKIASLVV